MGSMVLLIVNNIYAGGRSSRLSIVDVAVQDRKACLYSLNSAKSKFWDYIIDPNPNPKNFDQNSHTAHTRHPLHLPNGALPPKSILFAKRIYRHVFCSSLLFARSNHAPPPPTIRSDFFSYPRKAIEPFAFQQPEPPERPAPVELDISDMPLTDDCSQGHSALGKRALSPQLIDN
jgi:hypothetical protein